MIADHTNWPLQWTESHGTLGSSVLSTKRTMEGLHILSLVFDETSCDEEVLATREENNYKNIS